MHTAPLLSVVCWLPLLLVASACNSEETKAQANGKVSSGSSSIGDEPRGTLVVFAAASLTDVFGAIEADFEAAHPEVDVKVNFAGSQSLRTQIQNGARGQVFASANEGHMQALLGQGLVEAPVDFASNELVIVVPVGNPAGIESLADLPRAKRLVLAGDNVPAGLYANEVLASAASEYGADFIKSVESSIVSRETHVRQTLQKVVLGEADAALVYKTDAASAGDKVMTINIPAKHNVLATYPIAVLSDAKRAHLGHLFVAYLASKAGRARLTEFGFQPIAPVVSALPASTPSAKE